MSRVTLYVADGCYLCAEAEAHLQRLRGELAFELEIVGIDGDDELEREYRVLLPVVEIDGVRAFTFEVDPVELRERLA